MTTDKMDALEEMVEKAVAGTLFGIVKTLVEQGGVTIPRAVQLASFMVLDGGAPGALKGLGLQDRTARDWRADVRDAFAKVELPDDLPQEYVASLLDAMQPRLSYVADDPADVVLVSQSGQRWVPAAKDSAGNPLTMEQIEAMAKELGAKIERRS